MPAPAALIDAARSGDARAFEQLVAPYRGELQAHCYRMLGSLHDAEDAVQDSLARAWRSVGSLDERGFVRAWLYKIATNRCLTAIEQRRRRELPAGVAPGTPAAEISWLDAWQAGDVRTTVAMLADDARYSMPPLPQWYQGRDEIRAFLLRDPLQSRWRFLPTRANGQIAFGTYRWDDAAGAYIPGGLDVLTLLGGRGSDIVAFLTAHLTPFGLPAHVRP